MSYRNNILFCAVDIGGRIELYSNYLKTKNSNIKVDSFVKFKLPLKQEETHYTYYFKYDKQNKLIQYLISCLFFLYTLFKYKTIYILSGENILPRKALKFELWVYNFLNKNIIMHFVGADIRNSDYLKWRSANLLGGTLPKPPKQTDFQKKLCQIAEKKATYIIVTTPDLICFFNNESNVLYIPVFFNLDKNKKKIKKSAKAKKTTVLHAPSNVQIKGTEYISSIFNKLKDEFPNIEIINTADEKYCENVHPPYTVTKKTMFKLLNHSTILIDQIIIGWYGMQSIEGLFFSNSTICRIDENLLKYLPENCPIITYSDHNDFEKTLRKLIKSNTIVDSEKQKKWVLLHHTIENNKKINMLFSQIFNTEF